MSESVVEKACPVVLRRKKRHWEILAFEHHSLGLQLAKGTIETNEAPADAAVRELQEESGLVASFRPDFLFETDELGDADRWYFYLCVFPENLPDGWMFRTEDEGGQNWRFFWHNLDAELSDEWHPLFVDVFALLRPALKAVLTDR